MLMLALVGLPTRLVWMLAAPRPLMGPAVMSTL